MTKDSNEVESPSHTSLMHVAARVEAKNASSHFKLGQMDFTCSAMAVAWRMYRAWIKSKDKDKCCFNILIFIWLQGECQNCVIRRAGFNVIIIIATHALILRAGPDRSLKPYDLHPVAPTLWKEMRATLFQNSKHHSLPTLVCQRRFSWVALNRRVRDWLPPCSCGHWASFDTPMLASSLEFIVFNPHILVFE